MNSGATLKSQISTRFPNKRGGGEVGGEGQGNYFKVLMAKIFPNLMNTANPKTQN